MTTIRLRHVSRFRDRHGHLRHYLRIPGRKPVALPGKPGSAAFMAAYQAEVAAAQAAGPQPPAPKTPRAGTFDALAVAYYQHRAFTGLKPSSQASLRRVVEALRATHGGDPVALLTAEAVRHLLRQRDATPAAANRLLSVLRAMLTVAVEQGMLATNPALGVERRRYEKRPYPAWSEDAIGRFEAHWPAGSKPRLALYLLLYTGQRRSDVVRMGRQHLRAGELEVRQQKTGTPCLIPTHPLLAAELARLPEGQMTFLMTPQGRSYTAAGFYQRFIGWAQEAGLPRTGWSPHGGRKACGRRLAEAGCTAPMIMAILGHRTLSEAQRYIDDFNRAQAARDGMERMRIARLPTR